MEATSLGPRSPKPWAALSPLSHTAWHSDCQSFPNQTVGTCSLGSVSTLCRSWTSLVGGTNNKGSIVYWALQSKALGLGLTFLYASNKHFYGPYVQQTLFKALHKYEFN